MDGSSPSIEAAERRLGLGICNNWLYDVNRQVYKERPRQDQCFKSLACISNPEEAAWKLFYTLRAIGQMRELRDWREPLVKHLEENQLWLPGVTIDCYLDSVSYHTKYIDLKRGTNWIEMAKTRFALEKLKIEPVSCENPVPSKKRTYFETVLNHDDGIDRPTSSRSKTTSKRTRITSTTLTPPPPESTSCLKPPPDESSTISPRVPSTVWPCVIDAAYPSIISSAQTGTKLPTLIKDEFAVEPGPNDWDEGDIQHWFDVLQATCARIKVITLPITYTELKGQAEAARKKKNKAQQNYTEAEDAQWQRAVEDWDAVTPGLPVIEGDAILKTMDGEVVLYKLDTILTEGWENPELGAKFVAHLTENLETLRQAWGGDLPCPGKADTRHHAFEHMRELYGKHHVGVWHFAFWVVQGNPHRGPVVSAETLGNRNVYRNEPVQRFLKSIIPLQQAAAIIFQLLEPEACKRYKRNFDALSAKYTSMRSTFDITPRATFLGLAIPFQVRVLPHKDNADDPEGYVGMTNLGSYTGGDLVVGSDRTMLRFSYQPGQFVAFKSALLRHGVMPFEGKRRALVLFSHEAVWDFAE